MKKLLAVSTLLIGTMLSSMQVNASTTFNFQELIDTSTGEIYGELANGAGFATEASPANSGEQAFNYFYWTKDGIRLKASATYDGAGSYSSDASGGNDGAYSAGESYKAWAYLDKGNAGLGVCHEGLKHDKKGDNQCDRSSDDNVTLNEILNIAFDQVVSFDFSKLVFIDSGHGRLTSGTIKYSINGGATFQDLNLADLASIGTVNGQNFAFKTTDDSNQFYINSVAATATSVPEPSTLAIFGLGLMGLASRRFKKQS
jgi:hypothetical protein